MGGVSSDDLLDPTQVRGDSCVLQPVAEDGQHEIEGSEDKQNL